MSGRTSGRWLPRRSIALLAVSASMGVTTAWTQTATLDAQPGTIDVPPWEQRVQARIVLRNGGNDVLVSPTLTSLTNDSFQVTIDSSRVSRVDPLDSLVWTVRIDKLDRARIPGSVVFEASYRVEGKRGVQRLYTTLKLQPSASASDKPIEVTVDGRFDAITELRPGTGYLLVTNNLDVPVNIGPVTILQTHQKDFAEPTVEPNRFTMKERSSSTAAITLPAAGQVTPGKRTVVFDIEANWEQGGHQHTRHLMVSKEVDVGIFFESEILKALGVPSFLVLPGCLFVFTMQLLLTLGLFGVNRYSKVPDVPVTSPGFWIIAIMYSGLFAWIYTAVTGTDYLVRYGGRDLRNVWLWSIFLGFVVYTIIAVVTFWRREQRVPKTSDDPVDTLLKMGRRGMGTLASPVTFTMNDTQLKAFLIERIEDGQSKVWIAPPIVAEWKDGKEALAEQARVEQLVNERRAAQEIGEALRDAKARQYTTVRWATAGSVPNPYHLDVQNITQYAAPDQMLGIS